MTLPPKHQLADPALAARLLGVNADALIRGRAAGPAIPRDGTLLGGGVVAFEVKLAREVEDRDLRHLKWLAEKTGNDLLDAVVITTGPEAYRRKDGIAVVPAPLLGQ